MTVYPKFRIQVVHVTYKKMFVVTVSPKVDVK